MKQAKSYSELTENAEQFNKDHPDLKPDKAVTDVESAELQAYATDNNETNLVENHNQLGELAKGLAKPDANLDNFDSEVHALSVDSQRQRSEADLKAGRVDQALQRVKRASS